MDAKPFTQAEYMEWIKTRDTEPANWDRASCLRADAHIKETTLANFSKHINRFMAPHCLAVVPFLETAARAHFGSLEVDEMMMKMKCYPNYMPSQLTRR